MKNDIKRIIISVVIMVILSSLTVFANVKYIDITNLEPEELTPAMFDSQEEYENFTEALSISKKQENAVAMARVLNSKYLTDKDNYPDWYGGHYIADNHTDLVIMIVEGHEHMKEQILADTSQQILRDIIVFEDTEYSQAELMTLQRNLPLSDEMCSSSYIARGRLYVEIYKKYQYSRAVTNIVSDPRIVVEYVDGYCSLTANVYGGNAITIAKTFEAEYEHIIL